MDFLCEWLLKHDDVEVRFRGENGLLRGGRYVHIKICRDDYAVTRIVDHKDLPFLEVIFNGMYSELVSKCGSD